MGRLFCQIVGKALTVWLRSNHELRHPLHARRALGLAPGWSELAYRKSADLQSLLTHSPRLSDCKPPLFTSSDFPRHTHSEHMQRNNTAIKVCSSLRTILNMKASCVRQNMIMFHIFETIFGGSNHSPHSCSTLSSKTSSYIIGKEELDTSSTSSNSSHPNTTSGRDTLVSFLSILPKFFLSLSFLPLLHLLLSSDTGWPAKVVYKGSPLCPRRGSGSSAPAVLPFPLPDPKLKMPCLTFCRNPGAIAAGNLTLAPPKLELSWADEMFEELVLQGDPTVATPQLCKDATAYAIRG